MYKKKWYRCCHCRMCRSVDSKIKKSVKKQSARKFRHVNKNNLRNGVEETIDVGSWYLA